MTWLLCSIQSLFVFETVYPVLGAPDIPVRETYFSCLWHLSHVRVRVRNECLPHRSCFACLQVFCTGSLSQGESTQLVESFKTILSFVWPGASHTHTLEARPGGLSIHSALNPLSTMTHWDYHFLNIFSHKKHFRWKRLSTWKTIWNAGEVTKKTTIAGPHQTTIIQTNILNNWITLIKHTGINNWMILI